MNQTLYMYLTDKVYKDSNSFRLDLNAIIKKNYILTKPHFSFVGVGVDATDHKGLTPLMMACMFGRSLTAAYLLGRGAQPHLTDMNGDSALHWAAYKGYPSLMQMLVYSGFDPQKPDNFGSSPLHLACISGNLMAVKLLCAKSSVELEPR
jgi:ankyrin repeat protein